MVLTDSVPRTGLRATITGVVRAVEAGKRKNTFAGEQHGSTADHKTGKSGDPEKGEYLARSCVT